MVLAVVMVGTTSCGMQAQLYGSNGMSNGGVVQQQQPSRPSVGSIVVRQLARGLLMAGLMVLDNQYYSYNGYNYPIYYMRLPNGGYDYYYDPAGRYLHPDGLYYNQPYFSGGSNPAAAQIARSEMLINSGGGRLRIVQ